MGSPAPVRRTALSVFTGTIHSRSACHVEGSVFSRPAARSLRLWGRIALIAAIVAAIIYVIVAAWPVIVPFLLGLILAWIVLPAINWLERHLPRPLHRHGIARLIAIFLVYGAVLAIIVAFFYFFVPLVIREAGMLLSRSAEFLSSIQASLAGLRDWFNRTFPPNVRSFILSQIPSTAQGWLSLLGASLFQGLTGFRISWAVIFAYIIVPFWLIYVLYDSARFRRAALSLFPENVLPDVRNVGRILNEVAGGYLRGQVLVAASIGVLTGLALYLLGVDFPIVLGVITAIGDLIPTFGPIIAAIPVVIVAAFQRPILALWALLAVLGVREFEDLFVGPNVVGWATRLRPALIMILLLIAGYLWGLLGLLLVVPVAAVLRDIAHYLLLRTSPRDISPDQALKEVHRSWRRARGYDVVRPPYEGRTDR